MAGPRSWDRSVLNVLVFLWRYEAWCIFGLVVSLAVVSSYVLAAHSLYIQDEWARFRSIPRHLKAVLGSSILVLSASLGAIGCLFACRYFRRILVRCFASSIDVEPLDIAKGAAVPYAAWYRAAAAGILAGFASPVSGKKSGEESWSMLILAPFTAASNVEKAAMLRNFGLLFSSSPRLSAPNECELVGGAFALTREACIYFMGAGIMASSWLFDDPMTKISNWSSMWSSIALLVLACWQSAFVEGLFRGVYACGTRCVVSSTVGKTYNVRSNASGVIMLRDWHGTADVLIVGRKYSDELLQDSLAIVKFRMLRSASMRQRVNGWTATPQLTHLINAWNSDIAEEGAVGNATSTA